MKNEPTYSKHALAAYGAELATGSTRQASLGQLVALTLNEATRNDVQALAVACCIEYVIEQADKQLAARFNALHKLAGGWNSQHVAQGNEGIRLLLRTARNAANECANKRVDELRMIEQIKAMAAREIDAASVSLFI